MELEYAAIAKLLDHALLAPTLTRADLQKGLEFARRYDVASVCIVPFAVALATEALAGSAVNVSTVIGFPHGSQATRTKLAEASLALGEGAVELDAVANVNRVLSGEFDAVRAEIAELTALCHERGAKIKLIFENCYLQDDHKIRLCEIAGDCGVDWVKTSTGTAAGGATLSDLALMRRYAPASVQVKASGGIRDLDTVLRMREFVTRCGTSRSREILDECRSRLGLAALPG